MGRSIAGGNRWGGAHEDKREIARRQRQAVKRWFRLRLRIPGEVSFARTLYREAGDRDAHVERLDRLAGL